jgi:hypothetical protein
MNLCLVSVQEKCHRRRQAVCRSFPRGRLLTNKRHQAGLRGSRIVPSCQTAISRRGLEVATPKNGHKDAL